MQPVKVITHLSTSPPYIYENDLIITHLFVFLAKIINIMSSHNLKLLSFGITSTKKLKERCLKKPCFIKNFSLAPTFTVMLCLFCSWWRKTMFFRNMLDVFIFLLFYCFKKFFSFMLSINITFYKITQLHAEQCITSNF